MQRTSGDTSKGNENLGEVSCSLWQKKKNDNQLLAMGINPLTSPLKMCTGMTDLANSHDFVKDFVKPLQHNLPKDFLSPFFSVIYAIFKSKNTMVPAYNFLFFCTDLKN